MFHSMRLRFSGAAFCLIIVMVIAGCARRETDVRPMAASEVDEVDVVDVVEPRQTDLAVEPDYTSDPFYCQIAVGPETGDRFWTAADLEARSVYVDLNGNLDLTDSGERFELVESPSIQNSRNWTSTIPEVRQGEDVHTDLKLVYQRRGDHVTAVVSMRLWGWDDSTTDADLIPLTLSDENGRPPLIHFNGPLTMGMYRATTEIPMGREFDFYSLIGTPGEHGGTLTAISNTEIPDDAHPQALFEFPHRDATQPPIRLTTFLTVRC